MICPRCQTDAEPAAESVITAQAASVAGAEARSMGATDALPVPVAVAAPPVVQVCATCGQTSVDGRLATYDDIRLLPLTQLDRLRSISASVVEQTRTARS